MKTLALTPAQPLTARLKAALQRRGLILLLLVALLTAGCGPGSIAGSWAGINVDADGLIVANLDRVVRFNEVGTIIWEFPRASERQPTMQFYARPALTEEVVYAGGFDHKVYAINRSNGLTIWVNEDATDRIIGGLVVAQGKVIVGMGSGGLMALNQTDGQQEWFLETDSGIWSAPLVVGDTIYFGSLDRSLRAVDLDTGEELWRTDLEGAVAGTPAYADGTLYIGSFGHKMFAVSAGDGNILDTFETHNWVWGGPALSEDGILYFGDLSGYVYALEAATFEPVWQQQIASEAIRATPLVVDDYLIIGSRDNSIYVILRETALPVWSQDTGGDVLSDLVMLNENTLVVSMIDAERTLATYNLDNGREVWVYPPTSGDS